MTTRKYILTHKTFDGFESLEGGVKQRKTFKEGDVVELTDEQAAVFKDRFISVEEHKARQTIEKAKREAAEKAEQAILEANAKEQAKAKKEAGIDDKKPAAGNAGNAPPAPKKAA